MTSIPHGPCARLTIWLLHRNPFYLLSALAMAAAGRLYLGDSACEPGEIYAIVLTLLILQVYEWVIGALLVAIGRMGHVPEDEHSLLIVAGLFWTGPIAATIELTVRNPTAGAILAAGVAAVAIGELAAAVGFVGLRLSRTSWSIGLTCLIFLVLWPIALRLSTGVGGHHELVLYAGWWILALVALIGGCCVGNVLNLGFMLFAIGAVTVHLIGMNHAFFCNAAPFYASPMLVSLALLGMRAQAQIAKLRTWSTVFAASLPIVAIGLCFTAFSPDVPVDVLPSVLRDPIPVVSLMAAAIWGYAFLLRRIPIFLHLSAAAFALAVYRGAGTWIVDAVPALGHSPGFSPWLGLYVAVLYLLIIAWLRRSRAELLGAVVVHALGVVALVWGQTSLDLFITKLVVGWSALAVLHLVAERPSMVPRLLAIVVLAEAAWSHRGFWMGYAHAGFLPIALIVLGVWFRSTRYHWIGLSILGIECSILVAQAPIARANVAAIIAFGLLAAGAMISFAKRKWIERLRASSRDGVRQPDRSP